MLRLAVLLTLFSLACAVRSPRPRSFVLEIQCPKAGDVGGSYSVLAGRKAGAPKDVPFRSSDFATRPIRIRARGR